MANTSGVSSLRLTTTDGLSLEAEVVVPDEPVAAAVLTHPHPQHGGNMQSLVTGELFRTLPERHLAVLRFNFRGVGASEGSYGGGVDEQLDVEAALATLAELVGDVPTGIAGWSFGADVSLRVDDPRHGGWFLVAPPLSLVPVDEMVAAHDPRPKLLAVPEHDNFRQPEAARQVVADWVHTEVEVVPGADHFLVGRTDQVADLAVGFLTALDGGGRSAMR